MGVDWNKVATDNKEVIDQEEGYVSPLNENEIDKIVAEAENRVSKVNLNCLIVGKDGVGKSGVVMDRANKYEKKTLFIDLDGGDRELKDTYYKDNKKMIVICPLVSHEVKDDIVIDYKATIAKIKALVLHVNRHISEYDAIVIDGLSSLLKDAEYLMRMEKNMTVDGGVNQLYWKVRAKTFIDVLEITKMLPGIDRYFIGHEDFDVDEPKPGEKISTPKLVVNRMIHQRIVCRKEIEGKKVMFKAIIDKSKYNSNMEGKEIVFCTVENGKAVWNPDLVFEGLKGEVKQ